MSRSHRTSLLCCALLALASCKGKKPPSETQDVPAGSGAATAPALTGWNRIEALATPTVSPGPSNDLECALRIAQDNRDAWRPLRFQYPPTRLADYPHGAEALEALHAWVASHGGLPAAPRPTDVGVAPLAIHTLGGLAIDGATDTNAISIDDGVYLGTRLLAEGRGFLEVQVGLSLIADANRKRAMLAGETGGSAAEPDVPPLDLVRILAAEALQSRRTLDYAATPEGRKDFIDRAKQLEPETSELVEDVTGKTPLALIPTDEEAAGLGLFWLAALDGAQRGEPASTTIARAKKAAETAGAPAKTNATMIASMLETLQHQLERLSEPSPF